MAQRKWTYNETRRVYYHVKKVQRGETSIYAACKFLAPQMNRTFEAIRKAIRRRLMNIDDVDKDKVKIPEGSKFQALFDHQYKAQLQYEAIERRNGFYHPGPTRPSLEDAQFQHWLKDMFWRTTEELAEAVECLDQMVLKTDQNETMPNWRSEWESNAVIRHFFEELADANHFIINASIYAGLDPASIDVIWKELQGSPDRIPGASITRKCVHDIVMRMGLAANCLKNKPWKTTQMPTDVHAFRLKLLSAWRPLCAMWVWLGCSLDEFYTMYMRKYTVNTFRRDTRY